MKKRFAIFNHRTLLGLLLCLSVLLGGCSPVHKAEESVAVVSEKSGMADGAGAYSTVLSPNKAKEEKACCEKPPNRAAMMRDANPRPAQ